jgi:uncharacterized membrane protein
VRFGFGQSGWSWAVVALTVLAAILRFVTLGHQSYWLDEAQAVHELRQSFGGMLSLWSKYEWNPPLYLIVAWPWTRVFGTGEVGLRALSALLGTALIPLLYLCGKELVSRRAGVVAAAFAAVNPFMIWYSQEAREYMLLVVLCAGSVLFFARLWREPERDRHLIWWAVFSALALLTQYFAAFLIAAEAVAILTRRRDMRVLGAGAALAVLQLALIPHVVPRLDSPAQFIVSLPLSLRIQQVPVTFAMNTLYESSIVSYGLIGAAALAAAMIALLVVGAEGRELRGAGLACALAAAVLVTPLLLALVGHDDYIARGLMPGWVPLAIAVAAACTAGGTRVAGALLAILLLATFVYAGVRIDRDQQFQKPNWRGVAAALGTARGQRAIVAYDNVFATAPLSIYLHGVPWTGPGLAPLGPAPVSVAEVDVVGPSADTIGRLPVGTRLLSDRVVDGYRVARFALARPWDLNPTAIGARAGSLLVPGSTQAEVMIQRDA